MTDNCDECLEDQVSGMRKSLSITEVGVIVSTICSLFAIIFTGGILYGDVKRDTKRIDILEPKVDALVLQNARIDANVEFLVAARKRTDNVDSN